jgi:hypothetical protein
VSWSTTQSEDEGLDDVSNSFRTAWVRMVRLSAAVLVFGWALGACDDSSEGEENPSAQVAKAVNQWRAALSEGDGEAACASMTISGRRDMRKPYAYIRPKQRPLGKSCEEAVERLRGDAGSDGLAAIPHPVVAANVRIFDGKAAVVQTEGFCVYLGLEQDEWRIQALPFPAPDDPTFPSGEPQRCRPL